MGYVVGPGPRLVIALGGNALGGSAAEQRELVQGTAGHIVDLVAAGANVVVTHGNGPQVGMISEAFEVMHGADARVASMPFPECGAMSQGYIGYQLTQAILRELKRRGVDRGAATVLTQTVVYPDDEAFLEPSKPVGVFLSEEEARARAAETGDVYADDAGRGWRLLVASPTPQRIVEMDAITDLLNCGYVVVAAGGGGVPVVERDDAYFGVAAVIDKDRTSAKLAADLDADMLVILTAVERVCLDFGTPEQRELDVLHAADARRFAAEGQFAAGSMLPKVQACLEFVEARPGGRALITSLERAAEGLAGKTGTLIVE